MLYILNLPLYKGKFIKHHYLLIIDPAPLDHEIKNYFAQFNIEVMQEKNLDLISAYHELPNALLIDYAVLHDNPEIIKQFYIKYPVPLFITCEQRNEDFCIDMLEAGADDFLIKPIYPRELHARINAISRRVLRTTPKLEQEREVLSFMRWRVYLSSRQVFDQNNNEVILSVGEYELLLIFIQNPQKILNREFLSRLTKNIHLNPLDRRIDVQISRLRQKIESDARKPVLIKTIRNGGYIFTAPVVILKESDIF